MQYKGREIKYFCEETLYNQKKQWERPFNFTIFIENKAYHSILKLSPRTGILMKRGKNLCCTINCDSSVHQI